MEFTEIYQTYHSLLFSIAYRMLGSVTDAEDVVQELFVSLQNSNLNEITNMKAYLSKITTNHCINLLKSSRRKKKYTLGHGCRSRWSVSSTINRYI